MKFPPATIDGADVLEWAWSDIPFGTVASIDATDSTTIHGLALCRYPNSSTIYRFSCDEHWESVQDADYDSVAAAREALPKQYHNAPIVWHKREKV
ncbi:MAG: hypothetical protein AAGF95_08225 [Chloroflexota bacterium]